MTKIRSIIEEYDNYVKQCYISNLDSEVLKECIMERTKILIHDMSSIKIGNIITINRLIEMALGLETSIGMSKNTKGKGTKYTRKILNILYKTNKYKFLLNFS